MISENGNMTIIDWQQYVYNMANGQLKTGYETFNAGDILL